MNVGILTFHDGINYGAFFQVYALHCFLRQHGFQCQVINYKSLGFTLREYLVFLHPRLPVQQIMRNIVKIRKFQKAQRRLCLTRRMLTGARLAGHHFDRVIIGSDEVWNFRTRLIGYDPVYFSQGLKADRFISYAASFGNVDSHEDIPEQLRAALGRIEYVSVRDANSAQIMRGISRKPVQIVMDPTFLVDIQMESIRPRERGFILVYGFFDAAMMRQVREYARYVGKRTLSAGYQCAGCDISLDTLSPFEWLGYFATCDCVITTMFHGMVFSLLNQKEFCMFSTPYRKKKVGTFLSDLELSNRFVNSGGAITEAFAEPIDYLRVSARLAIWRRESEKFLLGALQS